MKVSLALMVLLGACLVASEQLKGITRFYYIAAEEVDWDYLPTNYDLFHGVPIEESPHGAVFCVQGDDRIGKVYRKALYFEYTDGSFATRKPKASWLGTLGPIIRAEVGDILKVQFMNKATFNYSMHPHGVFYDKNNEGAKYNDGDPFKTGAVVLPGFNYTYTWEVRERSGPAANDASSILWSYHSHVNEVMDVYSGLIGPMIIYKPGLLGADGLPMGIDREFVLYLLVGDENQSHYLDYNIKTFCYKPDTVDPEDDAFIESNLMHGTASAEDSPPR
jgi:hypothetical protein